jgi:adenylate cyclase
VSLRPLGTVTVRGREEALAVFEPWPPEAPPAWRARYLAAHRLADDDPAAAAVLFDALATEHADDPVPRGIATRLREQMAKDR